MLIKSIHLRNFRQFVDERVEFSTDQNKNVTVVLGNNKGGKTTLANAFMWCLYNDNLFSDKELLNLNRREDLKIGKTTVVLVTVEILHAGKKYKVTRTEEYEKINDEKVKKGLKLLSLDIMSGGKTKLETNNLAQQAINQIIPRALAPYFFFNGERVEAMSKTIMRSGTTEFKGAAERLLGLDYLQNAIKHLTGVGSTSAHSRVEQRYKKDTTNIEVQKMIDQKANNSDTIANLECQLETKKLEKENFLIAISGLDDAISKSENAKEIEEANKKMLKDVSELKSKYVKTQEILLSKFWNEAQGWLLKKMILDANTLLNDRGDTDNGIPHIHRDTIEYLRERGYCICGEKLEHGDKHWRELEKLLKYIPPQSMGTTIEQFRNYAKLKRKSSNNMLKALVSDFDRIMTFSTEHERYEDEIKKNGEKLKNLQDVQMLNFERLTAQKDLEDTRQVLSNILTEMESLKHDNELIDADLPTLLKGVEYNKEIDILKNYICSISSDLQRLYKDREKDIRKELENEMNSIFKRIDDSELKLVLDDKYLVKVVKDSTNREVETSTAQGYTVIFSFIAAMLELMKKSEKTRDLMNALEVYPLLMDAPLSAFDNSRIKAITELLPKVAEQILIFIKDTDGEIAIEHMEGKIGKYYIIEKLDDYNSIIKEEDLDVIERRI